MGEHDQVNELSVRLPGTPASVPRARALLRGTLAAWGVADDVLDSAELIVSELVTNALRAEASADRRVGFGFVWDAERGILRIEVSDGGDGKPEVRMPGQNETGGRGLLLVEALAQGWGVQPNQADIGKTVWAELKVPTP